MAFTRAGYPVYSGEGDDKDWENISGTMGTVDVAPSNARAQTGSRCNAFDLVGVSKSAYLLAGRANPGKLIVMQGAAGLSAAPASEMALIYAGAHRPFRIGTDRKLRIYDKAGVQHGAASTTLIPTAGLQEFTIAIDGLTLSTVWIAIAFGTSWEITVDTGLAWPDFFNGSPTLYWGDVTDAATNRNCTLYLDDANYQESNTPADVPHITAYPRHRISSAANGDGNGFHSGGAGNWTDGPGAAATFAQVDNDELPTHDAEGSYWKTTGVSVTQTVKSSAANPIPVGATIAWLMQRTVGRSTDATKGPYNCLMRLGGVDLTTNMAYVPTTSYLGNYTFDVSRPGGGLWLRADFDPNVLEWGIVSATTGSVSLRCTLHLGPDIVYYSSLLPLSPTPTGAIAPEPNAPPQIEGGKGPLLRPDYNHAMRPTGLLRDIETIRRQTDRSIRGRRACGRSGSVRVAR